MADQAAAQAVQVARTAEAIQRAFYDVRSDLTSRRADVGNAAGEWWGQASEEKRRALMTELQGYAGGPVPETMTEAFFFLNGKFPRSRQPTPEEDLQAEIRREQRERYEATRRLPGR